jgi:hypothetical protein
MLLADLLFAPGRQPGDLLEPGLWLAGSLLLAALCLLLIQRSWRRRALQSEDSAHDQLARFRSLFEHGGMSREEYDRVHALLSTRIQDQVNPAARAPAPTRDSTRTGLSGHPKPDAPSGEAGPPGI